MLLLARLLWVDQLHAQLGLALVPMRAELQMSAGNQYTDSVRLSNDSPETVRVRSEQLDFYIDDTLTPQFAPGYEKEKNFSCTDWIQINPREAELKAKETTRIRYTVQVPAGTPEGEYHCGAGFVTLPPIRQEDAAGMGVHMAVRAVTSIYVLIGKPTSAPSLKDLSLRNLADGTQQVVATFENKGKRLFRVQGFLEVKDDKGQLVERVEYPNFPVLPEREQAFPLPLKQSL